MLVSEAVIFICINRLAQRLLNQSRAFSSTSPYNRNLFKRDSLRITKIEVRFFLFLFLLKKKIQSIPWELLYRVKEKRFFHFLFLLIGIDREERLSHIMFRWLSSPNLTHQPLGIISTTRSYPSSVLLSTSWCHLLSCLRFAPIWCNLPKPRPIHLALRARLASECSNCYSSTLPDVAAVHHPMTSSRNPPFFTLIPFCWSNVKFLWKGGRILSTLKSVFLEREMYSLLKLNWL